MLNRSKIVSQLKILCISFLLALYLQNFTVAQEREKYVKKNPSVIKKWIVEAVKGNTKAVSGKLLLDRFRGPIYFLTDKIYWSPNAEASNLPSIAVPEGFVTDFASVPPMFFSVLRPDGEYAYAAVIHDYLYWTREVTREQADLILWYAMQDFKVHKAKAILIFSAVRAGGWWAWNENQKIKANGGKRILKRFPQDPTVTWEEWRSRPGVFVDN